MKTLARLIRQNVFTTFGVIVLALIGNFVVLISITYGFSPARRADIIGIAEDFTRAADGTIQLEQNAEAKVQQNWLWGMLLSDDGEVIWQYNLPPSLDRHYTLGDVAGFTRYYLDDYPTQVYRNDYGLMVLGSEKNSTWKYNLEYAMPVVESVKHAMPVVLGVELLLILLACLLAAWLGYRSIGHAMAGVDAMAEGEPITVPEKGITFELAHKLNLASERLQRQNALIARRDNARTNWVAGVSHDIRTPLAVIVGNAEQIAGDPAACPESKRRAEIIRAQSMKISSLVADLNLTSKLQYNAQPLHRTLCRAGSLLRRAVTDFCNSGAADDCAVDFELTEAAGNAVLHVDESLILRAFDNLLGNSARHNPGGCRIRVRGALYTESAGAMLEVSITDDGAGYPPAVLASLRYGAEEGTDAAAPHILGLHVVEQVAAAHGGRVIFDQNTPRGAKTLLYLPVQPPAERDGDRKKSAGKA